MPILSNITKHNKKQTPTTFSQKWKFEKISKERKKEACMPTCCPTSEYDKLALAKSEGVFCKAKSFVLVQGCNECFLTKYNIYNFISIYECNCICVTTFR